MRTSFEVGELVEGGSEEGRRGVRGDMILVKHFEKIRSRSEARRRKAAAAAGFQEVASNG